MSLATVSPRAIWTAVIAFICLAIAAYGFVAVWLVQVTVRTFPDPTTVYLLNSLSTFRGAVYHYIDHPGTPVEVLGTALLALTLPFVGSAPEGVFAYHIAHPEVFLRMGQLVILGASLIASVVMARAAFSPGHSSRSGAALAAALPGLFFVAQPDGFLRTLAVWSHDAFCYAGATLLTLAIVLSVSRGRAPAWWKVIALGLASGALTAIQLYFAPLVLGAAVASATAARLDPRTRTRSVRRVEVVFGMAAVGFVLATAPIWSRYQEFVLWIWELVTHQGIYGRGEAGFSTPERLTTNTLGLVVQAPLLFGAVGLVSALLVLRLVRDARGTSHDPALWAAGLGLIAQMLLIIVLVAKHPATKYLLPLAATLPPLALVALRGLDVRSPALQRLVATAGVGIVVLFAAAAWIAGRDLVDVAERLRQTDTASEQVFERIAHERGMDRSALRVVWTYGTASPCFALWLADDYADRLFEGDISPICPHDGELNVWLGQIRPAGAWDVAVIPAQLVDAYAPAVPRGTIYRSGIESLGYGELVFVSRSP